MTSKRTLKRVMLSEFLPPDYGAVGQYCNIFCRRDARDGLDVVLVGFTSGEARTDVEEFGPGRLTTVRLHNPAVSRQSLRARAFWTLKANIRLIRAALPYMRDADEVHFTGSPPFLIQFMVPLNALLGKKLVYLLTDFYPEFVMAHLKRVPLPLRLLFKFTVFLRHRVSHFEVLGFDQRDRLLEVGIPEERISIRRDFIPVAIEADQEPLPRPSGSEGKALLLYSGNLGAAHDVDTFVKAYVRHHKEGSGRVVLWLNAVGENAALMRDSLEQAGVPVISSKPVPIEKLAALLVTPDAHLITLRDEYVGYVLPSKTYGCIESSKPVLYIGSQKSDVHYLCSTRIKSSGDYHHAAVGDVGRVMESLEQIAEGACPRSGASSLSVGAGSV